MTTSTLQYLPGIGIVEILTPTTPTPGVVTTYVWPVLPRDFAPVLPDTESRLHRAHTTGLDEGCQPYNAYTDPKPVDTLAYWEYALERRRGVPCAAREALHPVVDGPTGTRHVGYRTHQENTQHLIRLGVLVRAGTNIYMNPAYRIDTAAAEALRLIAGGMTSEAEAEMRQELDVDAECAGAGSSEVAE